jgi:hypothetical protein
MNATETPSIWVALSFVVIAAACAMGFLFSVFIGLFDSLSRRIDKLERLARFSRMTAKPISNADEIETDGKDFTRGDERTREMEETRPKDE